MNYGLGVFEWWEQTILYRRSKSPYRLLSFDPGRGGGTSSAAAIAFRVFVQVVEFGQAGVRSSRDCAEHRQLIVP